MVPRTEYLKHLAIKHQVKVKSIAEIGVWLGVNAVGMRLNFIDANLYLIDPWQPSQEYIDTGHPPREEPIVYEVGYQQTKSLFQGDPMVTIIRKTSMDALDDVPNNLDLVFIDGDHSYEAVKNDILHWEKKVRPGGILAGHDYHPHYSGVVQAVDECLGGRFELGEESIWSTIKN